MKVGDTVQIKFEGHRLNKMHGTITAERKEPVNPDHKTWMVNIPGFPNTAVGPEADWPAWETNLILVQAARIEGKCAICETECGGACYDKWA